jgi:hypothetical protein
MCGHSRGVSFKPPPRWWAAMPRLTAAKISTGRKPQAKTSGLAREMGRKSYPGQMKRFEFVRHDPGRRVIQAEVPLGGSGQFNRVRVCGPGMRDWGNIDFGIAVLISRRYHDCTWSDFAPFFGAGPVLIVPQVGIGNDEARCRNRKRHFGMLLIERVAVLGRDFGGFDERQLAVREIGCGDSFALRLFHLMEGLCGDNVDRFPSVFCDADRGGKGAVVIDAEILLYVG